MNDGFDYEKCPHKKKNRLKLLVKTRKRLLMEKKKTNIYFHGV